MNRRRFLQWSGLALLASLIGGGDRLAAAGASRRHGAARNDATSSRFADWSRLARVADASFAENPDQSELEDLVATLRSQNVSVIEVDTILSNWLTEDQFTAHMADIGTFVQLAHATGMKVVIYYPSLEVISIGGEAGPSFYKNAEGARWAQLGLDGKPNVFYGSLVFWVDPGDESCWLSPNSPWRDYYLGRIRQLASTGVDGIWPDVPIYFDGLRDWCDTSSWGKTAFKADTGLDIPGTDDFTSPAFRRFIEWRHRNLNQWQLDIAAAGRSVNPNLVTFVETVTMDYEDGRKIGLDGAYLRQADNITQVWEVDVLSNSDSMRWATSDDWICLISMYKYARGASGTKPAWAFSFGTRADDAALVMAEVLAAGCNPFEVQAPGKTVSADPAMRTHLYAFIRANQDRIFRASSLATVALYHSSPSRDYVKPTEGSGLFANAIRPNGPAEWWSKNDPQLSCYQQQWLGEFRGMLKALVHAHVPFNVLTSPTLTAADLIAYKALMLPDLEAVSDGEAGIIREFVREGAAIVISGSNPTGMTELGADRSEYALADVLGFSKASALPPTKQSSFGKGHCYYFSDLLGGQYLRDNAQAAYDKLIGIGLQTVTPSVTLSGDRRIHLEATTLGADTIVHLVNFTSLGDRPRPFTTLSTKCTLSVAIPAGKQVTSVAVSSPDNPDPAMAPVPYSVIGATVSVPLTVATYALVAVTIS
jgi:hypothetical protein